MTDSGQKAKPTASAGDSRDVDMDTNGMHNGASSGTSTLGSAELRARRQRSTNGLSTPSTPLKNSNSHSPMELQSNPQSPAVKSEDEDIVGGGVTVKLEPGQAPKLSRATSKKVERRPARLFNNERDATEEAVSTYETIYACTYGNKNLGATEHGMECDCHEEWDASRGRNDACGEDSDCINRATKMECVGDCACGADCQNRRFQQQVYADVSVFKTERKGYGLRTNTNLKPHEFIFEYIGEVIGENIFYKRLRQYDQEGMKHFYFMSLNKGEFVDASKRGNLGRFCNHSCNPNCYVDKWVVGDKLRMGIFADRNITAGEELVFNYNVDRYGADPQKCYCGEPNCTGFIGGKNQTERATKLSALTIEALGIEDAEAWDSATAFARKPRKKRTEEADEEYVDRVQPKSLDENGVTKVMATLMQCKEKWIVVKLLSRIHRCDEPAVRNRVIRMHGYRILNSTLATWIEDDSICLQILDILHQFPRVTRNKIEDAKISKTVEQLRDRQDEQVKSKAINLLEAWSKLEMGYRIPRRDAAAIAAQEKAYEQDERRRAARGRSPSRSRSKSSSPERMKGLPTGPRASMPQRNANFFTARPPFRRPPVPTLPLGWYSAQAENGKTYFYNSSGGRTWDRPTTPAPQPPPPPKQTTNEQRLQDIINEITKTTSNKESGSASATPKTAPHSPKPSQKSEKWRSWDEDKKRRVYENTLFPHVKHVVDKYRGKLPKEDLKRFAKDVAKTLVNSDFKNKRVDDPTKVSSKQERQVKKYVKEYFDKAVDKRKAYDRKKAEKKAREEGSSKSVPESTTPLGTPPGHPSRAAADEEVVLSDVDDDDDDENSEQIIDDASDLKRKRDANETPLTGETPDDSEAPTPTKRVRPGTPPPPTPPPPPPPPPEPADDQLQSPLDQEMSEAPIKEAGLTPGEDVRGTFHNEALEAVAGAAGGQESPMDLSSPFESSNANKD